MIFVETALYSKLIDELLGEDEQIALQWYLMAHPDAGAVVAGSGGVRKLRWGTDGTIFPAVRRTGVAARAWSGDEGRGSGQARCCGLSFEGARSAFFDDYARQFFDEEHSDDEDWFLLLGVSDRARLPLVCHCEREGDSDKSVIRIISARRTTKSERSFHEGPLP